MKTWTRKLMTFAAMLLVATPAFLAIGCGSSQAPVDDNLNTPPGEEERPR